MHRRTLLFVLAALAPATAHAVFVRGKVTSPLGVPVAYARVQLIQGTRSVGEGIAGPDGSYEIRSGLSGRFLLLTSRGAMVQIGEPFYGGALDLVSKDILLAPGAIYPAPLASLPVQPLPISAQQLGAWTTLLPELAPAAFQVQQGPVGSPAYVLVQGAAPSATQIRIDDVSAEDLGGRFNFGTVSTAGFFADIPATALELLATPALPDAEAATLTLHTPLAESLNPVLLYTGSAGGLATVRNETVATIAYRRADLLGSFTRYDTANGVGAEAVPYHLATVGFNAGYRISANTGLRATLHQDVAATALAPFFGIARSGKDANQDLFASATFFTSTSRYWSNTLRYGLARKREQLYLFTPVPAQQVTVDGITASVTLPGAPPREDQSTNRDEATYITDYRFRRWFSPGLSARYQSERALDESAAHREALTRNHLTFAPSFSGEIRHRVFYRAGATVDRSPLYGLNGAPSLGLTYAAIRPGPRRFRGSILRADAATGFREPSLLEAYVPGTPRSRHFSLAEDQLILPSLTLTTTYFHNQFSHDYELRQQASATQQAVVTPTLAYRTQGLAFDLRFHPYPRVQLNAGYTYLASLTELSASNELLSAAQGARPFHRPPQTGSASAQYTGPRFTASFKAAFASRSDDSTTLTALQLPNRNLSPAWASLDAAASLVLTQHITFITQLNNLADSRSIAPIGYHSTPFLATAGLRIRLGRE